MSTSLEKLREKYGLEDTGDEFDKIFTTRKRNTTSISVKEEPKEEDFDYQYQIDEYRDQEVSSEQIDEYKQSQKGGYTINTASRGKDPSKINFVEWYQRYPNENILKSPLFISNNYDYKSKEHQKLVFLTEYKKYIDSFGSDIYTQEEYKNLSVYTDIDILITYSWNEDINESSISNNLYNAYELYRVLKSNTLPVDLGGLKIKILIPEFNILGTKTNLGPNENLGNEITKAIFTKYKGTKKDIYDLESDLIFSWHPSAIVLRKNQIPYNETTVLKEKYIPSSIVFVDGKIPEKTLIQSDNLHLCLYSHGFSKQDYIDLHQYQSIHYNFLCLYTDQRIKSLLNIYNNPIYTDQANILLYDDRPKICFELMEKNKLDILNESVHDINNKNIDSTYMVYLPKGTRSSYTQNGSKDKDFLDGILDVIDFKHLNPIAKEIQIEINSKIKEQRLQKRKLLKEKFLEDEKELQKTIKDSTLTRSEKKIARVAAKESIKECFNESLQQIDSNIIEEINQNYIEEFGYKTEDILNELGNNSPTILIVGLNDSNRNFEASLLRRALQRGIALNIKVYLQKELPIANLFNEFGTYIYTPNVDPNGDPIDNLLLDYDTRFIPECIWNKKKIVLASELEEYKNDKINKMLLKGQLNVTNLTSPGTTVISSKYHPLIGLNMRIKDLTNTFHIINEQQYKPTSKLTNNLLGNW